MLFTEFVQLLLYLPFCDHRQFLALVLALSDRSPRAPAHLGNSILLRSFGVLGLAPELLALLLHRDPWGASRGGRVRCLRSHEWWWRKFCRRNNRKGMVPPSVGVLAGVFKLWVLCWIWMIFGIMTRVYLRFFFVRATPMVVGKRFSHNHQLSSFLRARLGEDLWYIWNFICEISMGSKNLWKPMTIESIIIQWHRSYFLQQMAWKNWPSLCSWRPHIQFFWKNGTIYSFVWAQKP